MTNPGIKILLADDDLEDRYIITDSFKEIGHEEMISFVEDGVQLISYLNDLTDDALPNLIVMDLNMPRCDGIQTLTVLKKSSRYKNIPVIIFSTSANELDKIRCRDNGSAGYIIKPVLYKEYLHTAQYFVEFAIQHQQQYSLSE